MGTCIKRSIERTQGEWMQLTGDVSGRSEAAPLQAWMDIAANRRTGALSPARNRIADRDLSLEYRLESSRADQPLTDALRMWASEYETYVQANGGPDKARAEETWHVRCHLWWWTIRSVMRAACEIADESPGSRQARDALQRMAEGGAIARVGADHPGLWMLWRSFAQPRLFEILSVIPTEDSMWRLSSGSNGGRTVVRGRIRYLCEQGHGDLLRAMTEEEVLRIAIKSRATFEPLQLAKDVSAAQEPEPDRLWILGQGEGFGRLDDAAKRLDNWLKQQPDTLSESCMKVDRKNEHEEYSVYAQESDPSRVCDEPQEAVQVAHQSAVVDFLYRAVQRGFVTQVETQALHEGCSAALDGLKSAAEEAVNRNTWELATRLLESVLGDAQAIADLLTGHSLLSELGAVGRQDLQLASDDTRIVPAEDIAAFKVILKACDDAFLHAFGVPLDIHVTRDRMRRLRAVRTRLALASFEGLLGALQDEAVGWGFVSIDELRPHSECFAHDERMGNRLVLVDEHRFDDPGFDRILGSLSIAMVLTRERAPGALSVLLNNEGICSWILSRSSHPWGSKDVSRQFRDAEKSRGVVSALASALASDGDERHRRLLVVQSLLGTSDFGASQIDLRHVMSRLMLLGDLAEETAALSSPDPVYEHCARVVRTRVPLEPDGTPAIDDLKRFVGVIRGRWQASRGQCQSDRWGDDWFSTSYGNRHTPRFDLLARAAHDRVYPAAALCAEIRARREEDSEEIIRLIAEELV